MRLFVAIPLPDDVKESLARLRQPVEGFRWQNSDRYHLTLRFIGNVSRERFLAIDACLRKITAAPFSFSVRGLGYFPERGQPRVLWAGMEKNDALIHLQGQVEKGCRASGVEAETRTFKPHITLAKIKKTPRREVLSFINEHKQFELDSITVNKFVLYQSRLDADGAVHTPRETYKLSDT